jgi:hypothetical protein
LKQATKEFRLDFSIPILDGSAYSGETTLIMVMTILEGQVEPDKWQTLRDRYARETQSLDPGIVQTLLVQNSRELNMWRIVTLWQNRAVLDEMRKLVQTPRGVLMFREAGAEPALTVFDVAAFSAA